LENVDLVCGYDLLIQVNVTLTNETTNYGIMLRSEKNEVRNEGETAHCEGSQENERKIERRMHGSGG